MVHFTANQVWLPEGKWVWTWAAHWQICWFQEGRSWLTTSFVWSMHIQTFWTNDNDSLTRNKAIKGDDFPEINHDCNEGEQWGCDQIYPGVNIYIYICISNYPSIILLSSQSETIWNHSNESKPMKTPLVHPFFHVKSRGLTNRFPEINGESVTSHSRDLDPGRFQARLAGWIWAYYGLI